MEVHTTIIARCPHCGAEAQTPSEEIAHMESEHPEIIEERLRDASLHQALAEFRAKRRGV